MNKILGSVISGSLSEGFIVRLHPSIDIAEVKSGKFLCILSGQMKFFSIITDLKLEVTNNDILLFPPSEQDSFLQKFLLKKDIYATAHVKPMVCLDSEITSKKRTSDREQISTKRLHS